MFNLTRLIFNENNKPINNLTFNCRRVHLHIILLLLGRYLLITTLNNDKNDIK